MGNICLSQILRNIHSKLRKCVETWDPFNILNIFFENLVVDIFRNMRKKIVYGCSLVCNIYPLGMFLEYLRQINNIFGNSCANIRNKNNEWKFWGEFNFRNA